MSQEENESRIEKSEGMRRSKNFKRKIRDEKTNA